MNHEPEVGGAARGPGARHGFPRLVVAGLSGDSGKTLVSLALALALRRRGVDVRVFKKGPDYIDAAWLAWAAGREARNLDTWMGGFASVRTAFAQHATLDGLNLVEGNRGLFDGVDADGTHSTAELAKLLRAPVLLVVDARKATRTLAACVLGCQAFDSQLATSGVILNRVAGARHESVARKAIEDRCQVPVLGAIPRFEGNVLPGRHLGLVTPAEHPAIEDVRALAASVGGHLDLDAILRAATEGVTGDGVAEGTVAKEGRAVNARSVRSMSVRIACLRDSAFGFYYPENLEALQEAGAELVDVSPVSGGSLPEGINALYIGGGFPETHAAALAANRPLLEGIRRSAGRGLPVYAECGGLMLLARSLAWRGSRHEMAGVLPFDVEVCERPQGHGYATLVVDRANPFFSVGTLLRGHEFHYSRLEGGARGSNAIASMTACAVERGVGCGAGRDAIVQGNVWAAYTHLHALAVPEWATGLVRAAHRYAESANRQIGESPNR